MKLYGMIVALKLIENQYIIRRGFIQDIVDPQLRLLSKLAFVQTFGMQLKPLQYESIYTQFPTIGTDS